MDAAELVSESTLLQREHRRLAALYQLRLIDTVASESFDRVTRMACRIFDVPIAAVSLTDRNRQWFKSRVGFYSSEMPRETAPCSDVAVSKTMVVVPDLLADPRYADSGFARDGYRFYAGAPLVTRDGHGLGALCVVGLEPRDVMPEERAALTDLAAIMMAQIELQHAFGRVDPISGLPNRNQCLEDFSDVARECPGERRVAVLVDLAGPIELQSIMRVMGNCCVDTMVREVALTIGQLLGRDRVAYHVAATQFLFMSHVEVDAGVYLESVAASLAAARSKATARFANTAALGVVPFVLGERSADDVIRDAHNAAEDARQAGVPLCRYSSETDASHRRRFDIVNDFDEALAVNTQLRVVYQPRIDLKTGRCIGVEALVRWDHPTMGAISPGEFVPLIEQTSRARELTRRVLDIALGQLAVWHADGLVPSMSVNMSAANLAEEDFVAHVQSCLLKYDIEPHGFELELTESAIIGNAGLALERLIALAAIGVRLAIDDFGTGYSSLSYLRQVPAHVVKIDGSFIHHIDTAPESDRTLVRTMIDLSHKLGFRVVAEGVETIGAVAFLESAGCDEMQGYHFARPMPADELLQWLATPQSAASLGNDDCCGAAGNRTIRIADCSHECINGQSAPSSRR